MSQSLNPLRVVLVGCGGMAGCWLDAARQAGGVEWVGFVDLREEAARRRAAESGARNPVVGTKLETVLRATRPDAVFDCTVPEAHYEVTLTALAHGCHVLGEKPMADSMERARAMVAAAQKAGRIYAVIQNRRYGAPIRRIRRLIEAGGLGQLTTVHCDFFLGPHFGGFREQMRHVLLVDMAIHLFDMARYLSGSDATRVWCKSWNPAGSWYAHGASAVAVFEMRNGLVFTFRGSWCARGLSTGWNGEWRFLGAEGSAWWDGGDTFRAERLIEQVHGGDKMGPLTWEARADDKDGGHTGLIREFLECVRTGQVPETICSDNIKSLAMVFGAVESAETGRPVEIKPE
ncbi:MAG: Gfo/Idh/MocA family oxidoreductase [Verrucomicrobiae bacterium]|nr:Gfo/Idh/MocA family oxidoreductase [Verrucomicrobiae bacterium]